MLRIGLTGGIASGKSSAAKFFAEAGACVFDADAIVAELYGDGRPGAEAVGRLFGPSALASDGSVDKARLAALVFSDTEARRRLESAIHPLVVSEIRARFDAAERSGFPMAVAEASQIFEGGYEGAFGAVVLVTADSDERRRRARTRGLSGEEFDRRSGAQADDRSSATRTRHVIANDGSLEDLRRKVAALFLTLTANG